MTTPGPSPTRPAGTFRVFGARLPASWLIVFVAGIGLIGVLQLLIRYTRWGRGMRAMALNPAAAVVVGIPTRRYAILAFAVGSLMAGISGGCGRRLSMDPTYGESVAFVAFTIIIFAGMGSIGGVEPALGGIIGRGLLIDGPQIRGKEWLEPGEGLLPEELDAWLEAHSLAAEPGDILWVRTGRDAAERAGHGYDQGAHGSPALRPACHGCARRTSRRWSATWPTTSGRRPTSV